MKLSLALRCLAGIALAVPAIGGFAAGTVPKQSGEVWTCSSNSSSSRTGSSHGAACAAAVATIAPQNTTLPNGCGVHVTHALGALQTSNATTATYNVDRVTTYSGQQQNGNACPSGNTQQGVEGASASKTTEPQCPANSTPTPNGSTCTCDGGYSPDASGTQCVNGCSDKAGTGGVKNFTYAWSRQAGREVANTSDVSDIVGPVTAPPDTACDGSCVVTVGGWGGMWQSNTPSATGLYRVSVDATVQYTGASCSAATAGMDGNQPPQPCDGFVGQVNGVTRCVASKGSTPTNSAAPVPPGNIGNPAAGSDSAKGIGDGSRSPTDGTGGNGGGPPSPFDGNVRGGGASPGSTGSGTGNSSDPTKPCGVPGSAPCKIDESGTPNGQGAFSDANSKAGEVEQAAKDLVNASKTTVDKDTTWGFSFALPTGCTAIDIPELSFTMDPCHWQSVIHDLMSLVWIGATIWCCIGMVGRAMGGTA